MELQQEGGYGAAWHGARALLGGAGGWKSLGLEERVHICPEDLVSQYRTPRH